MKRLLCGLGLVSAVLAAGCGGGDQGRDPVLGLPATSLVSVAVSPTTASVAIGATQQFTATAAYSDGSARDITLLSAWTSGTPAAGTVDAARGMAIGVAAGTSVITAAFEGKSGSATLTVLPARLVSLAVAPVNPSINIGNTQQFVALGTFSDNTTRDISAVSTFSSASTNVASVVASTGLALGKAQGTSVISASSGGLTGNATLTVLPATLVSLGLTPAANSLAVGATAQLTALAGYSDGSIVDVTGASTYVSASTAQVAVAASGVITGVAPGTSVITASFGGRTATASATTLNGAVLPGVTISRLVVTPEIGTVVVNGSMPFAATAFYSNNTSAIVTTAVSWTSSSTAIATVLPTGIATGVSAGNVVLTAALDGASGTANLTVLPVVPVVPAPPVASVNLRSAATFGVLAGTALTNNSGGTTLITGDVGSPSQTTAPVVAPGFTNYQSGAILQTALNDLQLAIVDANSRLCTITFAGDIDFGSLVLTPGVYCYAGKINITGKLTLNGAGVYIFRTAQTLDTAANSEVELINGATADDVTWVPVGATTVAANSTFKGTVLGQAAAITVGDNATLLNGRVLSGVAVTLLNNRITK
ncbi:DUF3494 domain-containing protein [Oxalobacteraceae sp. CFBP 13730]|nr:DUF3494 domain-containing protein [Oxalobacteraceae sp. CFBP 13730]